MNAPMHKATACISEPFPQVAGNHKIYCCSSFMLLSQNNAGL